MRLKSMIAFIAGNPLVRNSGVRQFCKEAKEFQKHQYLLSFGEGRVRSKKAVFEIPL